MKKCILFLAGRYETRFRPYYQSLTLNHYTVAVDAGYRFFAESRLTPDLLIGDFDSLKRVPKGLSSKTEVLRFPPAKDKTDSHLALEHCLDKGATSIDMVQPHLGDPDHFIANLKLLTLCDPQRTRLRLLNARHEMCLVRNSAFACHKAKGDRISVIPESADIVYSCRGTAFDVTDVTIRRGETLATRNLITAPTPRFDIRGEAFVIRTYATPRTA